MENCPHRGTGIPVQEEQGPVEHSAGLLAASLAATSWLVAEDQYLAVPGPGGGVADLGSEVPVEHEHRVVQRAAVAGPRLHTVGPLPPAHDTFMTSPRMAALSWHGVKLFRRCVGMARRQEAQVRLPDGASRGTSTMSSPRQWTGSEPGSGDPNVVLADGLL